MNSFTLFFIFSPFFYSFLGTGDVLSKINRKREIREIPRSDIPSAPFLIKENTDIENENSENQINDIFLVTDPLLNFFDITKKLIPLRDDNENSYNDNYKNSNNNINNFSKATYLNNDGKSDGKAIYNFENADRNKWTWRPGSKIIEIIL